MAPAPDEHPEAVIQVYAARTWGWKGALAVHSLGRVQAGGRRRHTTATRWWAGAWQRRAGRAPQPSPAGRALGRQRPHAPARSARARGRGTDPEAAGRDRPLSLRSDLRDLARPEFQHVRSLARPRSPRAAATLPPTAIGKDFLGGQLAARTPSGTGLQLSLGGLLGIAVGIEEGVEVNILGLVLGLDPKRLGIKLPGIGQLGVG